LVHDCPVKCVRASIELGQCWKLKTKFLMNEVVWDGREDLPLICFTGEEITGSSHCMRKTSRVSMIYIGNGLKLSIEYQFLIYIRS